MPAAGGWHRATRKTLALGLARRDGGWGQNAAEAKRADAEERMTTDATDKLGAEKECRSKLPGIELSGHR